MENTETVEIHNNRSCLEETVGDVIKSPYRSISFLKQSYSIRRAHSGGKVEK